MKNEWLNYALEAAATPAAFYSGCRKIHRASVFTVRPKNDLAIGDIGFTKSKLTMLTRSYVHEESRDAAVLLWKGRLQRNKYGSVGFHCFSHYVKGAKKGEEMARIESGKGTSKRASVMGPCIQSVSLTLDNKGKTQVDLFYRTTELFKKFPADLVFIRDVLLEPFDFSSAPISSYTFHFANVTCHPMYFVTLIPMLDDPIGELEVLKKRDRYFFDWTVKWTARFLCPQYHRGIAKFAQALRVQKAAYELIPKRQLIAVRKYLIANHPGYRGDYIDDPDTDE